MNTITYNLVVKSLGSKNYLDNLRAVAARNKVGGRIVLFQDERVGVVDLGGASLEGVNWNLYSESLGVVKDFEAGIDDPQVPRWVFVTEKQYMRVRKKMASLRLEKGPETYEVSVIAYDGNFSLLETQAKRIPPRITANGQPPISVEYTLVANHIPASGASYVNSIRALRDTPGVFGLGVIFHDQELSIVDPRITQTYKNPRRWSYDKIVDVLQLYEGILQRRTVGSMRWMLVPPRSLGKVRNRLEKSDIAAMLGFDSLSVSTYNPPREGNGSGGKKGI